MINIKILVPMLLLATMMGSCGFRKGSKLPPPPGPVVTEIRSCPDPHIGDNIQITNAIGESNSPVIDWSGDSFSISWWDMRGRYPSVHATKLDRAGGLLLSSMMMSHEGISRHQQISSDAEKTNLVWLDEGSVMSVGLDLKEPVPVKLDKDSMHPAAGPWGAVAWVKKGRLLFRCDGMLPLPDREGVRLEPKPVVIAVGGIENPTLAWSGEHYGIVWSKSVKGGRQIMLQRITNKGAILGEVVKVSGTSGLSRNPSVIWTGKEFAVVWTNAASIEDNPLDRYRIFFAIVPAMGNEPRLTRQLKFNGSADQVALAGTGTEFAVSWVGSKKPLGSAVFFQRLDSNGMPLGETIRVSDEKSLTCGRPDLTWSGDGYGVAWHDDRKPDGSEVFFSFLKCGDEITVTSSESDKTDGGADAAAEPSMNKPSPENAADTPSLKDVF